MPFDFSTTVNNTTNSIAQNKYIGPIVRNPVLSALSCAFLIIIIIMFSFREAKLKESLFVTSLRAGFWSLLVVSLTIFLNNHALMTDKKYGNYDSDIKNIFAGYSTGGAYDGVYTSTIAPAGVDNF